MNKKILSFILILSTLGIWVIRPELAFASSILETIHKYPGNSLAFTVAASTGDVIVVGVMSNNGTNPATVTDNLGNTYTQQSYQKNGAGGAAISILTSTVTSAGTPTLTVSNFSDVGFTAYMVSGLTGATNATSTAETTTGTSITLTPTYSATASTFCFWGNETSKDFTSFSSPLTQYNFDQGHYDASGYELDASSGSKSYTVNLTSGAGLDQFGCIGMTNSAGGGGGGPNPIDNTSFSRRGKGRTLPTPSAIGH